MPTEIERKYLVRDDSWRSLADPGRSLRQGYLVCGPPTTVRVRLADSEAWLTLKGPMEGISRAEYEYGIPLAEAEEMLASLGIGSLIEKTRYRISHGALTIEVDVFHGANEGLITAEVELPSESTVFAPPAWFGAEVTQDRRYHNSQLARNPYRLWKNQNTS